MIAASLLGSTDIINAQPLADTPILPMICQSAQPAEGTTAKLAELVAKEAAAAAEWGHVRSQLESRLDDSTMVLVSKLEDLSTDHYFYAVLIAEKLVMAHMAGLAPLLRMVWDHAREDAYYALHEGRVCCSVMEQLRHG